MALLSGFYLKNFALIAAPYSLAFNGVNKKNMNNLPKDFH